jgi:hypothetical protein
MVNSINRQIPPSNQAQNDHADVPNHVKLHRILAKGIESIHKIIDNFKQNNTQNAPNRIKLDITIFGPCCNLFYREKELVDRIATQQDSTLPEETKELIDHLDELGRMLRGSCRSSRKHLRDIILIMASGDVDNTIAELRECAKKISIASDIVDKIQDMFRLVQNGCAGASNHGAPRSILAKYISKMFDKDVLKASYLFTSYMDDTDDVDDSDDVDTFDMSYLRKAF